LTTATYSESIKQVVEDIYQIRLPLPFALNSVNCYLLQGDDGWTIIDTGLNIPEAQAVWQAAFTALEIAPGDLHRIVLTHVHPDHYGLAGWLQGWSGAPVWLSPREAELAGRLWQQDNLHEAMFNLFRRAGVPTEVERQAEAEAKKVRELTFPHPDRTELLAPLAVLSTGRRQFKAIQAPGHSDGQLIFYDASDRLLLSGDQVLLKITPNIGQWPISEPDPLGRYLASLQELSQLEVRLALPGHRGLITHWAGRLAELQKHHADRLATMLAAVDGAGVTAYEVCHRVFNTRDFTMHEVRFAVAETLAHLEYLVGREQLRREENEVWLYRRV
jgi:glyoxylase-like metal-dependent hydrolase (beta-lactamase superfamily II)